MLDIESTFLNDLYLLQNTRFEDERGTFVKTFHADFFEKKRMQTDFKESYYSVSRKNVLRGMHFQLSPHDHAKLVYVTAGEILDVVVDIRKKSSSFGQYFTIVLSAERANSLYIGKGFAHGFLTLSDSATVVYQTTSTYHAEFDCGIRWDSFGFDWNDVPELIMSERDRDFPTLDVFGNV